MKSYGLFFEDSCVVNERSEHHSEKESFLKTPPKYVHRKVLFMFVGATSKLVNVSKNVPTKLYHIRHGFGYVAC